MKLSSGSLCGLEPKHAMFVVEYIKDFSVRRASEAVGVQASTGAGWLDREDVQKALDIVIRDMLYNAQIDAEWLLSELVDNHRIARQRGELGPSNAALGMLMKHVKVDAVAKDRVEVDVNDASALVERMRRGRERAAGQREDDEPPSFM